MQVLRIFGQKLPMRVELGVQVGQMKEPDLPRRSCSIHGVPSGDGR
jgi:hypothetical protein